ncbi:procathepsin L-like [Daphnia pulicaria]|uniref:procathepsin L-like n=1 Tax=Daphnia pulicaria TaxID=35523 RepID=UPI001EEACB24|nr:procathepsin L-like [Daphnia pulicaria]
MLLKMDFLFAFTVFAMVMTVVEGQTTEDDWRMNKKKFNKNYFIPADNGKLDRIHKQIFIKRNEQIKLHNSNPFANYRREVTLFSDMLLEEFQKFLGVNKNAIPPHTKQAVSLKPDGSDITDPDVPSRLDYRFDPCLPDIKNQNRCRASWAFSATTPIEFALCKLNKNISVTLSEQQLIDCDRGGLNKGCYGGFPMTAIESTMLTGIARESRYSYKKTGGQCKYVANMKAASVELCNYIEGGSIVDMKYALTKLGPISATMTVTDSFADYGSGVYDSNDCDGQDPNHAVVIVGWGNQNGMDYWIGRNSWGPLWGEEGYFLIQQGVNKCGIETYPVFVKLS